MKIKAGIYEILWMAAGAAAVLIYFLGAMYFQAKQVAAVQPDFRAGRVDIIAQMRITLTTASEAEKSAVMAVTDKESRDFADQARLAMAELEQERRKMGELLAAGGTRNEKELIAQFSAAFIELQNIDKVLLDLAVKNTNIKAYGLAFGPAADTLEEMNASLAGFIRKSAGSKASGNAALSAFGAQTAALHIQTLLAPHIAEESDKRMDELESLMAKDDKQVRKELDSLASLPEFRGDPDIKSAALCYGRYSGIKTRILTLSRENTNVHSLGLSLGRKRKVFLLCQGILAALQQDISGEKIAPGLNKETAPDSSSLQGAKAGTEK